MILRELKDYLRRRGCVPLEELARVFAMDADALRAALGEWEVRGRVRRSTPTGQCGGCTRCPAGAAELYEWVD